MDLIALAAHVIAFIPALFVIILVLAILNAISPKKETTKDDQKGDLATMVVKSSPPRATPTYSRTEPLWRRYPPMLKFEILYWRGVEETWRWNSYAHDLIQYAQEHLPLKYVEFYAYNSSRQDVNYSAHKHRIEQLRLKKIRRFPLVSINRDEEFIVVNSTRAYQALLDRIDAEWDRYYGLV